MAKKKKSKKQRLNPRDVLDGKMSVTALDLVRLIHRINPTPLNIASREVSDRYELKSQLQSLLIRQFRESLIIEQPDPDNPELVGFRLKHFNEDACHAMVRDLDEDVRSRVRMYLDTGGGLFTERRRDDPESGFSMTSQMETPLKFDTEDESLSVEALLQRGREALDEYDYELSETYFRKAVYESSGSISASSCLLMLYVDHLAAYDKAIDLLEILPAVVIKESLISRFLALAAAKTDRIDMALEMISNVSGSRPAEVYLRVFRHYRDRADVEQSERYLNLLKKSDDSHLVCSVKTVEEELKQLKTREIAASESQMQTAWDAGNLADATGFAEQILTEQPKHKQAQKILQKCKQMYLNTQFESFISQADEAHSRQNMQQEVLWLGKAMDTGMGDSEFRARYRKVRQALKHQQEVIEINEVLNLWRQEKTEASLQAFILLNSDQRNRIKKQIRDLRFVWLEQAADLNVTDRIETLLESIYVLHRCHADRDKKVEPSTLLKALSFHTSKLRRIPDYHRILEDLKVQVQHLESQKNVEFLEKFKAAFQAGNIQASSEWHGKITPGLLDSQNKKVFDDLSDDLEKNLNYQNLLSQYESVRQKKRLFEARDLAVRLAEDPVCDPEINWHEIVEEVSGEIDREWCLHVVDDPGLPSHIAMLSTTLMLDSRGSCLNKNGDQVIFATSHGNWIFIRIFSITKQKFQRAIVFRLSLSMEYCDVLLDEFLWIIGAEGYIVKLSLDPLHIVDRYDLRILWGPTDVVEDCHLFPNVNRALFEIRKQGWSNHNLAVWVNLKQRQITHKMACYSVLDVIKHGAGSFICNKVSKNGPLQMFTETGSPVCRITLEKYALFDNVAIHPNGKDYIFLTYMDTEDDTPAIPDNIAELAPLIPGNKADKESPELRLVVKPDRSDNPAPVFLENSYGFSRHNIVTALDSNLVFVHYITAGKEHIARLNAYQTNPEGFKQIYSVRAPDDLFMTTDPVSDKAVVIHYFQNKVRITYLDQVPPVFEITDRHSHLSSLFPLFHGFSTCGKPSGAFNEIIQTYVEILYRSTQKETNTIIRKLKRKKDTENLIALLHAFQNVYDFESAARLKEWLICHHPECDRLKIISAEKMFGGCFYAEIIEIMESISRSDLDDRTAAHVCHILGAAYLAQGDIKEATENWIEGANRKDADCKFYRFIEYTEICALSPEKRALVIKDQELHETLLALESYTLHRNREQWIPALDVMDKIPPDYLANIQFVFKMVDAYLNLDLQRVDKLWICKVVLFAEFVSVMKEHMLRFVPILPPRVGNPSNSQLCDRVNQASHWLENQV